MKSMSQPSLAKSFSLLTVLTLFEKIIAFVFQAILAALLGAGAMTDAYFSASELFGVLEVTAISSLTVVALNRYSEHVSQAGEEEGFAFLSNLLSFYVPIITVLSAVIFMLADPVSYVAAPGFSADARDILVLCIRVMAVIPVIECVTAIGLAVLRQKRRFALTSLKSLFISVVGIAFVVIFSKTEVNSAVMLSAAYVVSMLLFCILTMVYTAKYGKLRLVRPSFNGEIRATVRMILPLIVSYGISRTTLMIGKMIASFLGDGAVSQLSYAHSLYAVVSAVFITNLTVILLTDFNEMLREKAYRAVGDKLRFVSSVMTVFLIPVTVVSIVCSKDVVRIVFERGQFDRASTAAVASVLALYALSFIPAMIHGMYNQVLYANGDTKTPMWIAMVTIFVNVSVSVLLINSIGLGGVAVGSFVSSVIAVVLCRVRLAKCLPGYKGCYSIRFVCTCVIAALPCLLVALGIRLAALPALLSFGLTTVGCFAVFVLGLLLMKEENTVTALRTVGKKFFPGMKK